MLYGYRERDLPDALSRKPAGSVRIFLKGGGAVPRAAYPASLVRPYGSVLEIGWEPGDVCVLDRESVRGLLLGFPSASPFVLVSTRPSLVWALALCGLLRRLAMGQVRIAGTVMLGARRWMVLERRGGGKKKNPMFLSSEVGIRGLLDELRCQEVRYVVPRFFERLPDLYRKGGDLDLLVADEDEARVREFIAGNPGTTRIDVWSVSAPIHHGLPYMIPVLARKVLQSAVEGPAGSRIPAPKEAFLAFAYHVLYHKGTEAGVPTSISGLSVNPSPESDYLGELARMAREAAMAVPFNMESLDDMLAAEGWRPRTDTLAKIAERNEWVRRRFFAANRGEPVSFCVFILRRRALDRGLADRMREAVRSKGFRIVREKRLDGKEREYAADHLRGGTWREGAGSDGEVLLPALALVLHDPLADDGAKRFKALKNFLRASFDREAVSLVHSTDTEEEAEEYVRICFSGTEADAVLSRVRGMRAEASRARGMFSRLRALWEKVTQGVIRLLAG